MYFIQNSLFETRPALPTRRPGHVSILAVLGLTCLVFLANPASAFDDFDGDFGDDVDIGTPDWGVDAPGGGGDIIIDDSINIYRPGGGWGFVGGLAVGSALRRARRNRPYRVRRSYRRRPSRAQRRQLQRRPQKQGRKQRQKSKKK